MALNLGELYATIDADDRGFNRTIDRVRNKLDGTGKKMGSLTGLLGVLGKATAFSAMATGIAGAASALGPLLSLVSTLGVAMVGLGAAVPAFAVAGAAAVGALTIAFTGLGDAIAGDEEALERLAGPARDFVGVIEDLKPAWEDLTKGVQGAFFDDLSGTFKTVAEKILPRLKDGLETVASGLGDVAKAGLKAADSPRFLAGMTDVLDATGAGFAAFAKGVDGWITGFGILMSQFAPLIERVGVALGNLGDRFGAWMEQARATGQLQQVMQTMLDTLSLLGGIVQNIGGVFASVFSAANAQGGGLLGVIENLTGRLDAFFKSADGQEALGAFFASLSAVADAVIPIVLELAKAIGTDLAPHFATIATEVGPALKDLVIALGDAIGGIDVENLASGFAGVLSALTSLIGPVGEFLGWISQVEGLVPALVIALGAWTIAQWALNAALYANPIVWIIAAVIAFIAAIVLLVANWDIVAASLIAFWERIKEGATTVFTAIADFFVEWWPYLFAIMTGGLSLIVGLVIENWDAIKAFFIDTWTAISDFFTGVWDAIVAYVDQKIAEFFAVVAFLGTLKDKFSQWIGRAKDAAVDKFQALVSWVAGLPGRIMDKIQGLASDMVSFGGNVINGLLQGMKNAAGAVKDWLWGMLEDLGGAVKDFFGIASPSKLMKGYGVNIGEGLAIGIASTASAVDRAMAGLTTGLGLEVDQAAAPGSNLRVDATASLSEEDRELLRDAATMRNQVDVRLGANLTAATTRENAMVAA